MNVTITRFLDGLHTLQIQGCGGLITFDYNVNLCEGIHEELAELMTNDKGGVDFDDGEYCTSMVVWNNDYILNCGGLNITIPKATLTPLLKYALDNIKEYYPHSSNKIE